MPKKKVEEENAEGNALVHAAEALGKAAGKLAALTGIAGEAPPATAPPAVHKTNRGKLPKKNKQRLPRRMKKAQKKKQAV